MRQLNKVLEVYTDPNGKAGDLYMIENGLHVRDVYIHAGIGEEVTIGHTSDLHFNYCNQQDLDEANPVIMSTLEKRLWQANCKSVPNAQRCLAFLNELDQLVINGDTLDYLSHGTMEVMQREVWDKYPNVIATLGGHECVRRMQGLVEDPTTLESRMEILKAFWKHDVYYVSKVLKEKVMVVALFNDLSRFTWDQVEKFKADLQRAKENGHVMVVFAHEPIATHNPADRNIEREDVVLVGDKSVYPLNLCDGLMDDGSLRFLGCIHSDEPTMALYHLMVNNADIVKAYFAGHEHTHLYCEIIAKNSDGSDAIIPQYLNTANAYQEGHAMRICID